MNRLKKILLIVFSIVSINYFNNSITYADNVNDLNNNISASNKVIDKNITTNLYKDNNINDNISDLNSGSIYSQNNSQSSFNGIVSFAEVPTTTVKYHTSEEYVDGNFRINFWIDSIVGEAPAAVTAQINFLSEPTLSGPVSVQTSKVITKEGNITTGLLGYADFPAKTTFFAVTGSWGLLGYDGQTSVKPISMSSIYLQNKIGQNFPEYVDPISKKDAETPINTTWSKLPASPDWSTQDRHDFIKKFSETYGNQSKEYWLEHQVHHIRPRIYGGTNDFNNLMSITVNPHKLITTWFRNY